MCYIVSREGSKYSSSLGSSNEPTIIAFFHNIYNISFTKLYFIFVLRFVVVKGPETERIHLK